METIRVMTIPGLATALWLYQLFKLIPLSEANFTSNEFFNVFFCGPFLALYLLWKGIEVWEIANGELTISLGRSWIHLPNLGKVESSELQCVRSSTRFDNLVFDFTLRNPSRFLPKSRTVHPNNYENTHELLNLLNEFCGPVHNEEASSAPHNSIR